METHQGTLIFSGSWTLRPWLICKDDGTEFDIYPLIDAFLCKNNGKAAFQQDEPDYYQLLIDPDSEYRLDYVADDHAILKKIEGVGMSNLGYFLPHSLEIYSGRRVTLEVGDAKLRLGVGPDEDVHPVRLFGDGNNGRIKEEEEYTVCKMGTPDSCVFLTLSAEGFVCAKFSSASRLLLTKRFKGEIRSRRIGSCKVVGREG